MSLRTLLGLVSAKLVGLAVWRTAAKRTKSQAPTETTYSGPYDGSRTPWWQSESYFHDLVAFDSEGSGSTSTETMSQKSSELSPEDAQTLRLELFRKYGIREPIENE